MDVTSILNLLDKYGWLGLIIVFAGIFIIYMLKYQIANINKNVNSGLQQFATDITDSINETNGKLVESVIATQQQMLNYITTGQKEEHLININKRFDKGETLLNKVKDIHNKCHTNRTSIIEFHNSKENLNGLSFVWYDIQYEWQKKNVDAISAACKNMQASILVPVIEDLKNSENNMVIWHKQELDDLYEKSSVLHNYLVDKVKAQGMIWLGLHSTDNQLIGLLALEYTNDIPIDLIDIYELIDESGNISTILEIK